MRNYITEESLGSNKNNELANNFFKIFKNQIYNLLYMYYEFEFTYCVHFLIRVIESLSRK
jgi:hypothetical protein